MLARVTLEGVWGGGGGVVDEKIGHRQLIGLFSFFFPPHPLLMRFLFIYFHVFRKKEKERGKTTQVKPKDPSRSGAASADWPTVLHLSWTDAGKLRR